MPNATDQEAKTAPRHAFKRIRESTPAFTAFLMSDAANVFPAFKIVGKIDTAKTIRKGRAQMALDAYLIANDRSSKHTNPYKSGKGGYNL